MVFIGNSGLHMTPFLFKGPVTRLVQLHSTTRTMLGILAAPQLP